VREVELKLDLTEAAAEALQASDLLPDAPDIRELLAVYFDTPEQDLARAGISLRIRSAGEDRIQTVKADGAGSAGLFARSEWEVPVDGNDPILDDSTPVKALLGKRTQHIAPQFEVRVERRGWLLKEGKAEIEVVLDRGEVGAGEGAAPICELELELKAGSPAALFALARKIDALAPVRLGVLTKAERGYRLSEPQRPAFKAEPVLLRVGATAAEAFQHIAHACIRQFRLNETALAVSRSPEALHQARVALRRLRSAFSIFKPLFAEDARAAALREELRWLAGTLGAARDLDVLLARAPVGALSERIEEAREAAYGQVEEALGSPRARAAMLELAEWLADGSWLLAADTRDRRGEPVREFAMTTLRRFRKAVKRQGRNLKKLDDEARHDLRKSAKKLRYASEFFSALFEGRPRRYRRFIAALEDLQDRLGALNDLAAAPEVMHSTGLSDDPEADALLAGGKRKALIGAAADAHETLVDRKRFWR
jgi:inorganic triphosphatase YgiF